MRRIRTLPFNLRLFGLVLCGLLLSPYSYSQEIITEVETVTRDGLIYHQSSTEPLTGIVGVFENGQLMSRGNYRDGKLEGLSETFHNSGQVWARVNWKDGKQEGLLEKFYENGQLQRRENYVDGEREGLWESFDEDGNLTKTETYRNGVLVE